MNRSPKVAILIKTDSDWHRDVVRGIAQYAQDNGGWDFIVPRAEESGEVFLPDQWKGDGIICRLTSHRLASQIKNASVPAVNVSWQASQQQLPKVVSDEVACARMIAQYFIGKQYTNFAYIGFPPSSNYASTIEETLREELNQIEKPLHRYTLSDDSDNAMGIDVLTLHQWLRDLPKPVAVVVWSSHVGYRVVTACRSGEMDVPRDVSILCIEHDSLWSEIAPIPLSNLDQDPGRVGYAAASQLDSIMRGQTIPDQPTTVVPIAIVERLSTEATAVADPVLRMALQYIDEHAREGVSVKDLTAILGVSRRSLEAKFRRYLNCTPAAHIRSLQLQAVAKLLRSTNLTIAEIAKKTGYDYPEVLMRTFKRQYGMTPMKFRNSGLRSNPSQALRPNWLKRKRTSNPKNEEQ